MDGAIAGAATHECTPSAPPAPPPLRCSSAPLNYAIAYLGSSAFCLAGSFYGQERLDLIYAVVLTGVACILGLVFKVACVTPAVARSAWSTTISLGIVALGVAVLAMAALVELEPVVPVALLRALALSAEVVALLWGPVLWETAWDLEAAAHHAALIAGLSAEIYLGGAESSLIACFAICTTEIVRLMMHARATLLRCGCAPHHGTVGFFWLAVAALHILVRFPALALLHRYACGTAMWSPADPTNAPICWLPCVLHYQNWLLAWAFVDLAKLDWAGQHGGGRGKAIADAPHGFFPLLHRVHRHRVFGFEYRTQQVKVIKED